MKLAGFKTRKAAVEEALRLLARKKAYRDVLALPRQGPLDGRSRRTAPRERALTRPRGHRRHQRLGGFPGAARRRGIARRSRLGGQRLAVAAARNYRRLRRLGVVPRSATDVLIATFCIEEGHELLHSDRDFEPLARHFGLKVRLQVRTRSP